MDKTLEKRLLKSASILYAEDSSGEKEQASCFFLSVKGRTEHHYLITNKHVLKDKEKIHVYIDQYHKDSDTYTRHKKLTLHPGDSVKYHPDCDIAALCIDSIAKLNTDMKEYVYSTIDMEWVPDDLEQFSAFQDILMLGYPSGICDAVSNLPVARRGMTATPVWNDYKGQPSFLIDIPFLSGASGSPVLTEQDGKIWLLGIECSTLMDKTTEDCYPNRLYRSKMRTIEKETGLGMAVCASELKKLIL